MHLAFRKHLTESYFKRLPEKSAEQPKKVSFSPTVKQSLTVKKSSDGLIRRNISGQLKPKQRVSHSPGKAEETLTRMERKALRNRSFVDIYTDPTPRSLSPTLQRQPKSIESLQTLNKTLTDKLRALGSQYDLKSRFCVFQEVFSSVIALDPVSGLLLQRIKNGYEEVAMQFINCDYEEELRKLGKQVQEMQEILEMHQQEKDELLRNIAKLKSDNQTLLAKVSEQSTVSRGKRLIDSETTSLSEVVKNLQEEVTMLKKRESLLLAVADASKPVRIHRKTQSTCPVSIKSIVGKGNAKGEIALDQDWKEWKGGEEALGRSLVFYASQ